MNNTLSLELLEFIIVRTPEREGKYMGLKGTYATLVDACCRKQALPGFYQASLLADAVKTEKSLILKLSGEMTDDEMLLYLDAAIRNVGGFPATVDNKSGYMVEVKC
jgi:hypothetical protein